MLKKRFEISGEGIGTHHFDDYGHALTLYNAYKDCGITAELKQNNRLNEDEIIAYLRSMSSGLIGHMMGETKYRIIDLYLENAIHYAMGTPIFGSDNTDRIDTALMEDILLTANGRIN